MTLYVSDLDGTLLNYAGKLKTRGERMLNRFIGKGILFSYAAERPFQTAGHIMRNVHMNVPVITMNGIIFAARETGKTLPTGYIPEKGLSAASKANAALKLKEITGADRLICFGDGANDIFMFKVANECYAVENAVDELKAVATGVIPSNEEMGILTFIEEREYERFYYIPPPKIHIIPDGERFREACGGAGAAKAGIGTLNEKAVHAALKRYFSADIDREAKVGAYVADAVNENGVFEIQTSNWEKLNKKLECFLGVCHVTVIYPFEKRVHNISADEESGELIKKSVRNNKSLTEFFFELYRIRGFLTDKNLTICVAELEIEKINFIGKSPRKKNKTRKSVKTPLALLGETYLRSREDYRVFLPEDLPETFTLKEFGKAAKNCGGSILLEILGYMGIVRKCGKKGNGFLYQTRPPLDN
ncbi:MAG: HAD hydrolase family protein [Oscillospiraceae bacterium]|jgi:hypothetical protein|nr:HAD hydrolase family protein [Oscillospiraceae bacterium]